MDATPEAVTQKPELFFGLVAPVGSDLSRVTDDLKQALTTVAYRCETVHLIEQIHELEPWKDTPESPLDVRIDKHMDAGNELRHKLDRGDAIALLGVGAVRKFRGLHHVAAELPLTEKVQIPVSNAAYVFRSLKHPDEVRTLRRIYGDAFFLIAGYSPRRTRVEHLAGRIAESHHHFQLGEYRADAERLSQRDEAEMDDRLGQNVRKTFPQADIFIDTSDPVGTQQAVQRFVELVFGHPFHTPTRDEFSMFHARAAALRSSALGRQVGAVIATKEGDIIAVGSNEVPKAGGGLYWCNDKPDHRDFTLGYDTNDAIKLNIIGDFLKRLSDAGWLNDRQSATAVSDLVKQALSGDHPVLPKTSQVMNLTEFSRTVHAEMAALSDAARRGVPVGGDILYTSTFPCHNCAKHIVAAGIERVVYIEPYPKSLALDLHLDSIEVEGRGNDTDVNFTPFVGIAPRRYMDLFTAPERKDEDGKTVLWNSLRALPRFSIPNTYVRNETTQLSQFYSAMDSKDLKVVG
jgi:cytidine deaminase